MKLKRIISSALVLVLAFTALIAAVPPITAEAAYVSNGATAELTQDEIQALVKATIEYDDAPDVILEREKALGYLAEVHSPGENPQFSLYVNRYTGLMFYVNNYTGQILTSNPTDPGYKNNNAFVVSQENRELLMSQIVISYKVNSENKTQAPYNSTKWAADRGQISLDMINGGIRVNYTIGDTAARYLAPGRILAEDFEKMILRPAIETIEALAEECLGSTTDANLSFFENDNYQQYTTYGNYINVDPGSKNNVLKYFADIKDACAPYVKNGVQYEELYEMADSINNLVNKYDFINPRKYELDPKYEGKEINNSTYNRYIDKYYTPTSDTANLEIFDKNSENYHAAMYVISDAAASSDKNLIAQTIQKYNAIGYNFSAMTKDEKKCGYVDTTPKRPSFRCALEYTLAEDGTLMVRLPAASISFDETEYTLESITPLRFFGAGSIEEDGYIFFPDGSGSVVDFDSDFTNYAFTVGTPIYGNDYCYSSLVGTLSHREPITMPVYGLVNEVNASSATKDKYGLDKVTNGFFAILEEGASLAELAYEGNNLGKYANVYCNYSPYPSDEFDLSETISVGDATSYTIVSESKYNGSYVTKIVMLADETIAAAVEGYYPATYVGMAAYYRDYLTKTGVFEEMQSVSEVLPLYIEALGSMQISDKFLSFPITKSIPLTTFENILTMYSELTNNKDTFIRKADEYRALAEKTDDELLKAKYLKDAEEYDSYVAEAEKIEKINFRLTGFTNGGMHSTYPTKIRWERVCGGKRGFRELLAQSEENNFGVYPDFDFMYISNTAAFDGIRVKGNVSRMVDNRYASKQVYDSVLQEYLSYYTLVVNPNSYEELYDKFFKKYTKYEVTTISASTIGSDLNSNFDEDEPINRDDAESYVVKVLSKMKEQNLDIMVDQGNSYTYEYVSHILNASIDSSHYRYSSYTVPFLGMVLHGKVNYAGSPMNYTGLPQYDILRAIENGAAPYYVLCYQNSSYLKEDSLLNQYYGVDYNTWFKKIVSTYKEINDAIGNLQNYTISDHRVILGERVIDEKEVLANIVTLKSEMLDIVKNDIEARIAEGYKELDKDAPGQKIPLTITVDKALVKAQIADILNINLSDAAHKDFVTELDSIIDKKVAEYSKYNVPGAKVVEINSIRYNSSYAYFTESLATDKDYVTTDYTSDTNNIVMVTYTNGTETVRFIINYNIYAVTVRLSDTEIYTIERYGCIKLQ